MSEATLVRSRVDGAIAVLTLDHPPVNALSPAVVTALGKEFSTIEKNSAIRAVVLTAAGTNAFCAGADVKELEKLTPPEAGRLVELGQRTFAQFESSRLPVIAAVNGLALGGGLELALACDLRIAGERSRFGFPEVQLGLIPAWGGTQRAVRLLGAGKAKELIFTGAWINAQEAQRIGLVNKVVPDGDETRAAMDIAKTISVKCAPLAIAAAKRALLEGADLPIDKALAMEADAVAQLSVTKDLKEGILAMIEKRPPKFTGE